MIEPTGLQIACSFALVIMGFALMRMSRHVYSAWVPRLIGMLCWFVGLAWIGVMFSGWEV